MKYKQEFFDEECLECFNPSTACTEKLKHKCYIEWADKKLKIYKKQVSKIKNILVNQ